MIQTHIDPHRYADDILQWYQQHGRKTLPWQLNKTPFKVWLSEIMLQQTQVKTVIPYFNRFLEHYPTVADLAAAPQDDVLSLWSGLGYYARARNLHKAAQLIMSDFAGAFPDSLEDLMRLPGVGRSTAGAILALGFGQTAVILDGNVKRVLARTHQVDGDIKATQTINQLWALAETLTPDKHCPEYTQAMMDIGALICTRTSPSCAQCPITTHCLSAQEHTQQDYPVRKARTSSRRQRETQFVLLLNEQHEVLLEKRIDEGIWGGLWCFPSTTSRQLKTWCRQQLGIEVLEHETWRPILHRFSHFDLTIHPVFVRTFCQHAMIRDKSSHQWHSLPAAGQLGISTPVKKLLNLLHETDFFD